MKISVSVGDFPLFRSPKHLFSGLKEAGADGIELITGVKSRYRFQKLLRLSHTYDLPITSIHQPPWSILPGFFDEDFIREGTQIGVKHFVFHPIARYSFTDPPMKRYLEKLASTQEKYGVTIMLENMPVAIYQEVFKFLFPLSEDTKRIEDLVKAVKEYHLSMTLDTSHAYVPDPTKEAWFDEVFPYLGNIHLSSFNQKRDHLPVYMGEFHTKTFIHSLYEKKYKGLLNLEIFYPGQFQARSFDFAVIKKSIDFIRQIDH